MKFVEKLELIELRFEELTRQLSDPAVINDPEQYRKTAKAHSDISEVVGKYREWKAPRTWPKSSLSTRPAEIAEQFTLTRGRSRRGLRSWMARATSSLPVPVSPRISTVDGVGATVSTRESTFASAGLLPTISPKLWPSWISSWR
jgi:hypothetical protein